VNSGDSRARTTPVLMKKSFFVSEHVDAGELRRLNCNLHVVHDQ